jgi:hypothetical protein
MLEEPNIGTHNKQMFCASDTTYVNEILQNYDLEESYIEDSVIFIQILIKRHR